MQLSRIHIFVAAGALAAAGIGLIVATRGGDDAEKKSEEAAADKTKSKAMQEIERRKQNGEFDPPKKAESRVGKTLALRSFDKEIIDVLHGRAPAKETRDVLPRLPAQVDVFVTERAGEKPRISKLEVDIDRDGRYDERWRLDPENNLVRKAMAPDAEIRYLRDTYVLEGEQWALRSGNGATLDDGEPTAEQIAQNLAARELRPIDKKAIELARQKTPGTFDFKQPDGTVAKIVVFPNKQGRASSRVGLDFDGDKSYEEMLTLTLTGVRRTITAKSGKEDPERYALSGDKWRRL